MPSPIDPLLPDPDASAWPHAAEAPETGARAVATGWVPDTVPALPSAAGDRHAGSRATLTAMMTPPRWGGVRRSGHRRGDASLATARLGSCR